MLSRHLIILLSLSLSLMRTLSHAQSSLRGDALAEYATAHPSVVAFNTDGWLKLTLAARCAGK
jgi:hypothetical protein